MGKGDAGIMAEPPTYGVIFLLTYEDSGSIT